MKCVRQGKFWFTKGTLNMEQLRGEFAPHLSRSIAATTYDHKEITMKTRSSQIPHNLGLGLLLLATCLVLMGPWSAPQAAAQDKATVTGGQISKSAPALPPGISPFLPVEIISLSGPQNWGVTGTNHVPTTLRGPANLAGSGGPLTVACFANGAPDPNAPIVVVLPVNWAAGGLTCPASSDNIVLECTNAPCILMYIP